MDKTERLIALWSQEGHTASVIVGAQHLMQLSDEESCNSSSIHGSNGRSWAIKGQSKGSDDLSRRKATPMRKMKTKTVLDQSSSAKGQSEGSDHPSRCKVMSAPKIKTKAVLDQGRTLRPQKKRKYRSISEIYTETELVEARMGVDH